MTGMSRTVRALGSAVLLTLAMSATAVAAAPPRPAPALDRTAAALAEDGGVVRFQVDDQGDVTSVAGDVLGAFPRLPQAVSNATRSYDAGACGREPRADVLAVVDGELTRHAVETTSDGDPCRWQTTHRSWTIATGWAPTRQLVWAEFAWTTGVQRVYALGTDGAIRRYMIADTRRGSGQIRSFGAVAGFSSVRSLALAHSDGVQDVLLANLVDGSLQEIRIPAAFPMRTSVVPVRTRTWGVFEQLVTRPAGEGLTRVGGVDRGTGLLYSYTFGRLDGSRTSIRSSGPPVGGHTGPVVQGGADEVEPYLGAGPALAPPAPGPLPRGMGVVIRPGGLLAARSWSVPLPLGPPPSVVSDVDLASAEFCYDSSFVRFYAVSGDTLYLGASSDEAAGECNPTPASAGLRPGPSGFASVRELVWASTPSAVAPERLYTLSSDGVLRRYEPAGGFGEPLTVRSLGARGGWGAVKGLTLVRSDARGDVFLANLAGGALYELRVPAERAMRVAAVPVRARTWGGFEQLAATPRAGGWYLTGVDDATGAAYTYEVGPLRGSATSIRSLGREPDTYAGALVGGTGRITSIPSSTG